MPRDGSGTYSLPSGNPVVTGTAISSTTQNNTMSDVATALTGSIAKNGETTPSANLPMGGYKHTSIADGTTRDQYAAVGQVQDADNTTVGSVAGTNTITGSVTPAITAYVAGMIFSFEPANTNTSSVTINLNSVGAVAIVKGGSGSALVAGDLVVGVPAVVIYDGTQFFLLNPSSTGVPDGSAASPGLPFYSDTDTGIFRSGTNTLNITTGGAEAFRVAPHEDSTDREIIKVRAGTSTTTSYIIARDSTDATTTSLNVEGDDLTLIGGSDGTGNVIIETNGNERFRVAASGAIGLSGATYGSSGQVLTSSGSGSAPTWTSTSIQTLLDGIGTTQGQVLYYNGTDWVALAVGTSGQFLKTQGAAANPTWATLPFRFATSTIDLDGLFGGGAGSGTTGHSLGTTPYIIGTYIVCTSTDLGYAVGDRVTVQSGAPESSTVLQGITVWVDATDVGYSYGATDVEFKIRNKSTNALGSIAKTKWDLVVMLGY